MIIDVFIILAFLFAFLGTVITENIPPETTKEEDLYTQAQRKFNFIWEITQAVIALTVTLGKMALAFKLLENPSLDNAFFLVIGFYFGRTNHQRLGGVNK